MGRPGTVDDVANAVHFLVSDGAKQITGQTLIVDGGWSSISPNPE
jgi:NAD(P)-dependent dehydrogenase (short-subunit alcohol dehydrogenase family)